MVVATLNAVEVTIDHPRLMATLTATVNPDVVVRVYVIIRAIVEEILSALDMAMRKAFAATTVTDNVSPQDVAIVRPHPLRIVTATVKPGVVDRVYVNALLITAFIDNAVEVTTLYPRLKATVTDAVKLEIVALVKVMVLTIVDEAVKPAVTVL